MSADPVDLEGIEARLANLALIPATGFRADTIALIAEVRGLRKENEQLLRFAGLGLNESRDTEIGDWDGGSIQDAMVASGLLLPVEVTEACDPEHCQCAEVDCFPATCFRYTDLARKAVRAASPLPVSQP